MKVILLVGGYGTRLNPLTDKIPKAMLDLDGIPVINHTLDWLDDPDMGISQIDIPVGFGDHLLPLKIHVDANYSHLPIRWVDEGEPTGRTDAIIKCLDDVEKLSLSKPVLIIYGDMIMVGHNLDKFAESIKDMAVPIFSVDMTDTPEKYGVVEVDSDMWIKSIEEKPKSLSPTGICQVISIYPLTTN